MEPWELRDKLDLTDAANPKVASFGGETVQSSTLKVNKMLSKERRPKSGHAIPHRKPNLRQAIPVEDIQELMEWYRADLNADKHQIPKDINDILCRWANAGW